MNGTQDSVVLAEWKGLLEASWIQRQAKELGVVVLTNKDDHSLQRAIAMHLLDAFLGVPSQDWNRKYRSLETRRRGGRPTG